MGLTRNQVVMIAILLLGTFLCALNQTLLSPALSSIMADLSIDATTVQYVMSAYSLVQAIVIPLSAYLVGRFSTRQLFIFALCIFTVGSILAALSPNFIILLVGRAFQAIAAGILMPMVFTVIMLIFPREHRGSGMGLCTLIICFAPAVGPTLSGVLIESIGWRMLFVVVAIVGIVVVLGSIKFLKSSTEFEKTTLDILSFVLCAIGLVCLLYGLASFSSAENLFFPLLLIVIGIIVLAFFIHRQLHLKTPLLKVDILKTKKYRLSVIITMLGYGAQISMNTLFPLFLQNVIGFSALDTGLIMLPGALIGAFMGLLVGRLFDRFGVRKCVIPGICVFLLGAIGVATFNLDTTLVIIVVFYTIFALGIQCITTPMNTWGVNSLNNNVIQHSQALNNTSIQVAGSFMTALIVSITALGWMFAPNGTALEQTFIGDRIGFIAIAFVLFIAFIIIIFFVRDRKTEPSKHASYEMEQIAINVDPHQIPVRDAMNKQPYYVSNEATIREVCKILVEKKTSGIPIVDKRMRVVGFISDGDIMKYLGQSNNILDSSYMLYQVNDPDSFPERVCDLIDLNVMNIATKDVLSINSKTPLENACTLLSEKRIKKVPIVENGKLVGSLSRSDIIRSTMANLSTLQSLAKQE